MLIQNIRTKKEWTTQHVINTKNIHIFHYIAVKMLFTPLCARYSTFIHRNAFVISLYSAVWACTCTIIFHSLFQYHNYENSTVVGGQSNCIWHIILFLYPTRLNAANLSLITLKSALCVHIISNFPILGNPIIYKTYRIHRRAIKTAENR